MTKRQITTKRQNLARRRVEPDITQSLEELTGLVNQIVNTVNSLAADIDVIRNEQIRLGTAVAELAAERRKGRKYPTITPLPKAVP